MVPKLQTFFVVTIWNRCSELLIWNIDTKNSALPNSQKPYDHIPPVFCCYHIYHCLERMDMIKKLRTFFLLLFMNYYYKPFLQNIDVLPKSQTPGAWNVYVIDVYEAFNTYQNLSICYQDIYLFNCRQIEIIAKNHSCHTKTTNTWD